MKKRSFFLFGLLAVGLSSSVALALDPMGPAVASLKKGQYSAGVDYSHSTMDVELNEGKGSWRQYQNSILIGSASGKLPSYTIENMSLNKVYANIGYGIANNWEAFLRLGAADIDYKYRDDLWLSGQKLFPTGKKENGDAGFAIGFGTRATFYDQNDLQLGGLFQISWAKSDGRQSGAYPPDAGGVYPKWEAPHEWSNSVDIEIIEIQVALGPTYQLMDGVSIYGGPFFHFIDGSVDAKYRESGTGLGNTFLYLTKHSYDIDECAIFGGYVGLQVNAIKNASFNIEYQHTAAADALCMNLTHRF